MRTLAFATLAGTLASRGWGRGASGSSVRAPAWRGDVLDLVPLAWALVAIVAAVTGVSPRLSLLGEIEQREGAVGAVAIAALHFVIRHTHPNPSDRAGTENLWLGCAVVAASHAMLQFAGLDPLGWSRTAGYAAGSARVLRPFGPLGNPVLLGAVLAPALACVAARLASGRGDRTRLVPFGLLLAAALACTLSRGAWLAALAGVATGLALGVRANPAPAVGPVLTAAAATLGGWLAWSATALRAPLLARLAEGGDAVSSSARIEIARAALAIGRAHPWFGGGPDTFALLFPRVETAAFLRNEWLGLPVHAHSVPLQVAATLGLAGLLVGGAWLVLLARSLRDLWRMAPLAPTVDEARFDRSHVAGWSAALVALAVAGLVNPVGWAGAALFVTLSATIAAVARPDGTHRHPAPTAARWAWLASVAVAGLAAWPAGREMAALALAARARDGLEAAAGSDGPRTPVSGAAAPAALAERAARRSPGEDELWRIACDASLADARGARDSGDRLAASRAARDGERSARRAVSLEPLRASNFQRLGLALATRAAIERDSLLLAHAESAFATAGRLAPADPLVRVDRAGAELAAGRADRALVTARQLVALDPRSAHGHALEAAALLALGRRADARAALSRALAARWEDGTEAQREAAARFLRALEDSARH